MKQNDIFELTRLSPELLENAFSVHQTEDGMYYYDIMRSVSFPTNLPAALFDTYKIKPGDSWPLISFNAYKTTNLWWLILLANEIINPTVKPTVGVIIKTPRIEVVREVLSQISNSNG